MILTPAAREELITLAKSRAEPVANCVAASVPFGHLVDGLPREGLYALIAVLAEGADRCLLHQVVTATEDGPAGDVPPVAEPVPLRLRRAHAEYERYRKGGIAREDMPLLVCRGEAEYQEDYNRRRRERKAVAA